jgi:hypothetical protein
MMVECIDTLLTNGCSDMSVCGNNCAAAGQVPSDAIVLPVNNYGENFLRVSFSKLRCTWAWPFPQSSWRVENISSQSS